MIKMNRKLLVLNIFLTVSCLGYAAPKDSAYIERQNMLKTGLGQYDVNPAFYGRKYLFSQNELQLGFLHDRQKLAYVEQKGDGCFATRIRTESYIRLSKRSTVWGMASYRTRNTKHIRWNNTADYDLLAPDVTADSVGGDTKNEQYYFRGGYAGSYGRWTIGVEAEFRAEQEYRQRDPRMRGVVSDLNIRLGATREWLSYRWGVALSGNVYRQRNDVKFYNFDGGYSQYLMTGLGENYHRFADNKPDVQYRGDGVGISLQMMPATSQGWLASVSTSEHRYERILVSYNSLPLTTLYHQQIDLMVGWKREGDSDFAIWGEYRWNKRSSDESIVGASSVNVYPVEGTLTMYKYDITDASIHALYGRNGRHPWHLGIDAGYQNRHSSYAYPERKMNVARGYALVKAQRMTSLDDRWKLLTTIYTGYTKKLSSHIVMPYAIMEKSISEMIASNYRFACTDDFQGGVSVRADYQMRGGNTIYFQLAGDVIVSRPENNEQQVVCTLGITF
jgi:hypothetical protein